MSLNSQNFNKELINPIKLTSQGLGLHFIAYFILSLSGFLCYKINIKLILILINYGVMLEFLQYFLPTRSFNILDILSNILGVFFALYIRRFFIKNLIYRKN